ncbi:unnamed protein product [Rhodiola kirilowii]
MVTCQSSPFPNRSFVPGWKLNHILREGNKAADFLAKKAKEEAWSWIDFNSIPICVAEFAQEIE